QAKSGDLLGSVKMIDDPDRFVDPNPRMVKNLRDAALIQVINAIGPDNRQGADAVLNAALQAVDVNDHEIPWMRLQSQNQDRLHIALAYARVGQFDAAVKTAAAIDTVTLPGQLADAAKTRYRDDQKGWKATAFIGIAGLQRDAGDRDGARQSARE